MPVMTRPDTFAASAKPVVPARAAEASPPIGVSLPVQPPVKAMPRWRVWMVLGVLVFIVGGHLVEVVTQHEHWPFSPYQMWSIATQSWDLTDERLYGVTDEPSPREILLQDPSYFYPLPSRFMRLHMIRGLKEQEHGDSTHLNAITTDYLRQYEDRRKAGLHNGPPLKGLRMYRFHWLMARDASNVDKPDVTLMYQTDNVKGVKTPGPVVVRTKKGAGDGDLE